MKRVEVVDVLAAWTRVGKREIGEGEAGVKKSAAVFPTKNRDEVEIWKKVVASCSH